MPLFAQHNILSDGKNGHAITERNAHGVFFAGSIKGGLRDDAVAAGGDFFEQAIEAKPHFNEEWP